MRIAIRTIALSLAVPLGACAGNQLQSEQGASYVLEVQNPMPHPMNVSYSMGGSVTALGTVAANTTRTFNIPNRGGDEIVVIATDQNNQNRVEKPVDLESHRPARVVLST
jgi:hypothetical protein